MFKTKVLVLSGGNSSEREVSQRSGAAVATALTDAGYEVSQADPTERGFNFDEALKHCDVVFPALHGKGGEDGSIQAYLEMRGIPFVGAGSIASGICYDKWHYKQKLQAASLPVPHGELVNELEFWASPLIQAPFVLKPYDGGSSIDTFIIRDISSFDHNAFKPAFRRHIQMLLEQLIDGQELTVAILGAEALPVIEIVPPAGDEFNYKNKYNGKTHELCPPVSIGFEVQKRAQQLALQIHTMLGANDLSRTDMILDETGALWVLETNTIPGLTDQSLLPKAAAAGGYSMVDLVRNLVEAALARSRQ